MQHLVGDALGDPTLTLARWDAGAARPIATCEGGAVAGGGARLELTRDGRPYALVRYDAALDQPPEVVRGAAATGLMLLDNARLAEELRASRARIADASHEGRVRIERDLHDGVQPHLTALLVKLGIARDLAEEPELRALIDELGDDAAAAVQELRTLARGVYPPLLRERGLAQALQAFAVTAPVAVRVTERGTRLGFAGRDGGRLLHGPGGGPERDQARRRRHRDRGDARARAAGAARSRSPTTVPASTGGRPRRASAC